VRGRFHLLRALGGWNGGEDDQLRPRNPAICDILDSRYLRVFRGVVCALADRFTVCARTDRFTIREVWLGRSASLPADRFTIRVRARGRADRFTILMRGGGIVCAQGLSPRAF
jgi:hypothetical protein